jgi:hypothetical protein
LRDRLRLQGGAGAAVILSKDCDFLDFPRVARKHLLRPVTRRLLTAVAASALLLGSSASSALAAPGDGVCTVVPGSISNLTPTQVTLRSGADDATDAISAHVGLGHPLVIRDPGGDGTSRGNLRSVPAAEQQVLGENIGFTLPAANIAGQFEVLTMLSSATSDCVTATTPTGTPTATPTSTSTATPNATATASPSPTATPTVLPDVPLPEIGERESTPGPAPAPAPAPTGNSPVVVHASGIYDGLAIAQGEVIQLDADAKLPVLLRVRGTSRGVPLRASTLVTLSTSRGEFVSVNGTEISASKVIQLTLTQSASDGAAVGTVLWAVAAGERSGSTVMTATALQDGVSLFKSVQGRVLPPPTPDSAPFMGSLPGSGQSALLVTSKALPMSDLADAVDAAGCLPQTLSIIEGGQWLVYVPGAPDVVNIAFSAQLAPETPFVVRCV